MMNKDMDNTTGYRHGNSQAGHRWPPDANSQAGHRDITKPVCCLLGLSPSPLNLAFARIQIAPNFFLYFSVVTSFDPSTYS